MENNLDDELGLVSEADYAKFRGKKLSSVRNERSKGEGPPFVKMGGVIKYPLAGIKAFIAANTVTPRHTPTLTNPGRFVKRPK